MKVIGERAQMAVIVALSLALGFAGGFAGREFLDKNNRVYASEAASVPVQKVEEPEPGKVNRLIAPHLWDIYVDPLFSPVNWTLKPLPLVPLIDFSPATPKLQTIDGDKELRVIAQVPGMDEKDVKVEASEHAVTIRAHKKQEEKNNNKFESFDESFEQSVHLPCKVNADKVQASVKDGVLTVTLPKS
ncbi:MAG TPA: Hsp20/alpha crystallin family protein [Oculatellaceae cyanobacterium]